MRLKSLSAAVLLSFGTGAAEAALKNGLDAGIPSSFVLAVKDETTHNTYLRDLGLDYKALVEGTIISPITWNLGTDANFSSFVGHAGDLFYNITGGYRLDGDFLNFDKSNSWVSQGLPPFSDPINAQWGFVTTGVNPSNFGPLDYNNLLNASGLSTSQGFLQGFVGAGAAGKLGDNVSTVVAPNGTLAFFDDGSQLGYGPGTASVPVAASLINGNQLGHLFYLTSIDLTGVTGGPPVDLGTLQLSAGNILTFTPTVTAVPIPAAAWLLGSALLSMIGFARRQNKA